MLFCYYNHILVLPTIRSDFVKSETETWSKQSIVLYEQNFLIFIDRNQQIQASVIVISDQRQIL